MWHSLVEGSGFQNQRPISGRRLRMPRIPPLAGATSVVAGVSVVGAMAVTSVAGGLVASTALVGGVVGAGAVAVVDSDIVEAGAVAGSVVAATGVSATGEGDGAGATSVDTGADSS